jgi:Tfp pilus assembly protein PilZ
MDNSPQISYKERRRFPRIKYSIEVDWGETPACIYKGMITSLSIGGCFVQTPLETAKGDLIFIRLLLAPESARVMEGVVWGRVAYHVPEVGFGIEFKKLPPGYEEHIRDIVEFHLDAGEEA